MVTTIYYCHYYSSISTKKCSKRYQISTIVLTYDGDSEDVGRTSLKPRAPPIGKPDENSSRRERDRQTQENGYREF